MMWVSQKGRRGHPGSPSSLLPALMPVGIAPATSESYHYEDLSIPSAPPWKIQVAVESNSLLPVAPNARRHANCFDSVPGGWRPGSSLYRWQGRPVVRKVRNAPAISPASRNWDRDDDESVQQMVLPPLRNPSATHYPRRDLASRRRAAWPARMRKEHRIAQRNQIENCSRMSIENSRDSIKETLNPYLDPDFKIVLDSEESERARLPAVQSTLANSIVLRNVRNIWSGGSSRKRVLPPLSRERAEKKEDTDNGAIPDIHVVAPRSRTSSTNEDGQLEAKVLEDPKVSELPRSRIGSSSSSSRAQAKTKNKEEEAEELLHKAFAPDGATGQHLSVQSKRQSFTVEEMKELVRLFQDFDKDGSGTICGFELRCLLRHLGYPTSPREVFELTTKFDTEKSGELDIKQFGMVMMHVEESQHRAACEYFEIYCFENECDEMSPAAVCLALTEWGYSSSDETVKKAFTLFDQDGSGTIGLEEFIELMRHFRHEEKKRMLEFDGFTREEVIEFQRMFSDYDKDNSGELNFKECMNVLQDFGKMPQTQAQQMKMFDCMKDADLDGSGTLDMREFIRIIRRMTDEDECEIYAKEKEAAETAGFSEEEVTDWRDVFDDSSNDQGGEFNFTALRQLLRTMGMRLSKDKIDDLKQIFCLHAEPSLLVEFGHRLLFHQFLNVISYLLSIDFENMKECAAQTVANRESERTRLDALVCEVQEQAKQKHAR